MSPKPLFALCLAAALTAGPLAYAAPPAPAPPAPADSGDPEADRPPTRAAGARVDERGVIIVDDVVVTATQTKQQQTMVPLPVEVVTGEEIDETFPADVGELMEDTTGVSAFRPAGPRFAAPVIRGLSGRRVIVLADGLRVDTGKTMGATGFFLDPFTLARVEVLRGPGSVLYGSDAMGGVVNNLSTSPLAYAGFKGRAGLSYGTNNGETIARAGLGYSTDRFGVLLSAIRRDAGAYDSGSGEVGVSQYHDLTSDLKLGFRWGDGSETILGFLFYSADDVGKAQSALDITKRRRITFPDEQHYRASLAHDQRLSAEGPLRELRLRAVADWTDRHRLVEVFDDGWDNAVTHKARSGDFFFTGGTLSLLIEPGADQRITAGVEEYYHAMDNEDVDTVFVGGSAVPLGTTAGFVDATRNALGVFAQHEWAWRDVLSTIAGLRYDWIHFEPGATGAAEDGAREATDNHALSGNVGATWEVAEGLTLAANVGQAFRAPALREKYLDYASCYGFFCGNPDLDPERSTNLDLGLRGRFEALRFDLSVYYIHAEDLIATTAGQRAGCDREHVNIGAADLAGAEAQLSARYHPGGSWPIFKVFGATAYSWGHDQADDQPLPSVPPLSTRLGLRAEGLSALGRWYLQVESDLYAAQDRAAPGEAQTDAYATLGLRAGFVFPHSEDFGSVALRLRATNLSDESYRHHLSRVRGMGRNIRLSLDWTY